MKKKPQELPTTRSASEADRFIDFARKLMSVPKSEIDEKQAEYQKRRAVEREAVSRPSRKPTSR